MISRRRVLQLLGLPPFAGATTLLTPAPPVFEYAVNSTFIREVHAIDRATVKIWTNGHFCGCGDVPENFADGAVLEEIEVPL